MPVVGTNPLHYLHKPEHSDLNQVERNTHYLFTNWHQVPRTILCFTKMALIAFIDYRKSIVKRNDSFR